MPTVWTTTRKTPVGEASLRRTEDWRLIYYALIFSCIGIMVGPTPLTLLVELNVPGRSVVSTGLWNTHSDSLDTCMIQNGRCLFSMRYRSLALLYFGLLCGRQR
jgi:hypothetical protein